MAWWQSKHSGNSNRRFLSDTAHSGLVSDAVEDLGCSPLIYDELSGSRVAGVTREELWDKIKSQWADLRLVYEEPPGTDTDSASPFDTEARVLGSWNWVLVKEDTFLSVRISETRLVFDVRTRDRAFYESLKVFAAANTVAKPLNRSIYMLAAHKGGVSFQHVGTAGVPLVRENYDPKVVEKFDQIVSDLRRETPRGRISILEGPPGSGKSFYVRGILEEAGNAVTFSLVSAEDLVALSSPSVLPALLEFREENGNKPICFIVEDADMLLAQRMADNMSSLSAVLNLGDGILGRVLDIRIIATTNTEIDEIDPAILRPGRLSAYVHVGKLQAEQAAQVYRRIAGTDEGFESRATDLATIYQLAVARTIEEVPDMDKKVGFTT